MDTQVADNKEVQGQRIKVLRERLGFNQGQFATEIGLQQGSYSSIERGETRFSIKVLEILSQKFKVNLNWLLFGLGTMLLNNDEGLALNDSPIAYQKGKNYLVPASIQAGHLGEWTQEFIDQNLQRVFVPGISGNAMTFEVTGDSMLPTIRPGDYVVGKKLEKKDEILPNHVHIIISKSSGMYIKRVVTDDHLLILESDNTEFPPTTLAGDDVQEIYRAVMKLTKNLSGPRPVDARLQKLERFLAGKYEKEFLIDE